MPKLNLHFQRFEFKYYLPKNKADKIIPAFLAHMEWDPYIQGTGRDFYEVNSLYFDSSNFGCFWDKESGIADRKKLRLRFYGQEINDKTPVFVEIKRKKDALVIKDRIKLEAADCFNNVFDEKLLGLLSKDQENNFLQELVWFKKRNVMRPKLFVSYNRKALISKMDKRFRVTFDYNIKTKLLNDFKDYSCNNLKEVYPNGLILELKYNNILPAWFQQIIQKYQLQRIAFSKYCNSLRKVVPNLDDNNYSIN